MERNIRSLLGGGLRPNDPRRFLIEAMIGAMTADREDSADGVVDPRAAAAHLAQFSYAALVERARRLLGHLAQAFPNAGRQ